MLSPKGGRIQGPRRLAQFSSVKRERLSKTELPGTLVRAPAWVTKGWGQPACPPSVTRHRAALVAGQAGLQRCCDALWAPPVP